MDRLYSDLKQAEAKLELTQGIKVHLEERMMWKQRRVDFYRSQGDDAIANLLAADDKVVSERWNAVCCMVREARESVAYANLAITIAIERGGK